MFTYLHRSHLFLHVCYCCLCVFTYVVYLLHAYTVFSRPWGRFFWVRRRNRAEIDAYASWAKNPQNNRPLSDPSLSFTPRNRLSSCPPVVLGSPLDTSSAHAQVSTGPSTERSKEPDRRGQRGGPTDPPAIVRKQPQTIKKTVARLVSTRCQKCLCSAFQCFAVFFCVFSVLPGVYTVSSVAA